MLGTSLKNLKFLKLHTHRVFIVKIYSAMYFVIYTIYIPYIPYIYTIVPEATCHQHSQRSYIKLTVYNFIFKYYLRHHDLQYCL